MRGEYGAVGPADYGLPLNYMTTYGADGSPSEYPMLIPASVYKDNSQRSEVYAYSGNKQENNAGITYNKTADLNDSVTGTIYTHFNTAADTDPGDDNPQTPSYEESAAIPYNASTDYTYNSNWTVAHDTGK